MYWFLLKRNLIIFKNFFYNIIRNFQILGEKELRSAGIFPCKSRNIFWCSFKYFIWNLQNKNKKVFYFWSEVELIICMTFDPSVLLGRWLKLEINFSKQKALL